MVDVVAGALAGYTAYLLFLRSYPRDAVPESGQRLAPYRALGFIGLFGVMVASFWGRYKTGIAAA